MTTLQILTAVQRPAEYARLVAGLASPAVTVTRVTAERVYYHKPQGTEESASRADFKSRLTSIVLPG